MASISMSSHSARAPKGPTVAVILNFRTAGAAIEAVRSLQRSTTPVSSILVVDNGSGDGSPQRIASVPGIEVIEEPENRGFSAGCNVGIRRALERGAERVLVLNADVVVAPDSHGEMERVLDSDGNIGIIGPIVVSKGRPGIVESYGIGYSPRTGRMRNLDFGKTLSSTDRAERRVVDAVSGCTMLIKRDVFERAGLFNEDYFFGFEDIDLCLRARAVGFLSAVSGRTVVEHEGQASIGRQSDRRIYFATRNHLLLGRRSNPARTPPLRWLQTATILGLNLGYVLFSSETPRIAGLRAFARGARDHFAGRFQAGP
jgi:GT2 family glycosyltransferase